MKFKDRLLFPLVLSGIIIMGVVSRMWAGPVQLRFIPTAVAAPDTVVYPKDNYKSRRVGDFDAVSIADSLLAGTDSLEAISEVADTLPVLNARDTLVAPDSLRETDPFRFKYYIALLDSLTHRQVSDSLRAAGDSLLLADAVKLDSIYFADSAYRAKLAFEKWYASLSKEERKKYDFEQKELRKKARTDSLQFIKEEKKAIKDSIVKNTPRILDTYALPDSLHYKRIVAWTLDRDFGVVEPFVPDTSYNYHFYDYNFQRRDVNATWLGVAGSPVQYYNFFNREHKGTGFWNAYEPWSYTPQTFLQYNSKTPHTELAYFGTLMAGDEKESDNLHFLTTQNITPELNFNILFERWGGGGMLTNEETVNKTLGVGVNYLGKKYLLNTGILTNNISMGENGGLVDVAQIRDTTIDSREVEVANTVAKSKVKKATFYLDQQLRIPFNFINDMRKAKDSTYVAMDDITTAFIGHSLEYDHYARRYTQTSALSDSLGRNRLDNKLYFRLQPWTDRSLISKIDVGVGDEYSSYLNVSASDTSKVVENTLYAYAGASGSLGRNSGWHAKAHYSFAGAAAGDFDMSAGLTAKFYPFRRSKGSPVILNASLGTDIFRPEFYQRHFYSTVDEAFRWDKDLSKVSITKAQASLKIPHWRFSIDGGYAVLGNYTYYDTAGLLQQSASAVNVFTVNLREEFVIGDFLHLDNRVLVQHSSAQDVLPLPLVALNLKYFIQFPVQPGVMDMQIGVNGWYNTKWYSPQWNSITGTFANQNEWQYNNGPFFDVFVNVQWKTCCIFIKAQNLGAGWPMDHADYFSAHKHIVTTGFMPGLKLGIFWPFYLSPVQNRQANR